MADDDFQPSRVGDNTDLALLPRRFDAFVSEFRFAFELLANKILPKLDRMEDVANETRKFLGELEHRVVSVEARQDRIEAGVAVIAARQDDHARRLLALEANSAPRKRSPRK